jgi:hypothetical protein
VVSGVPLDEFQEITAASPVLPARLGTLFSSPERLTELMTRHYDKILGFLERVADHDEWSVKVFVDRQKALEARVSAERARSPRSSSITSSRPDSGGYLNRELRRHI